MPQENESNEFLKEFDPVQKPDDLFEAPLAPAAPEKEVVVEEDKAKEERGNRRERRLQEKLAAEREAGIALAARLQALTEAQKLQRDVASEDYLKVAEQIYGNQTPEQAAATELLKKALTGAEERAYARAMEAVREEQRKQREEQQKEESVLNDMVEDLEDTYNVDLTGNEQLRKNFFQLLNKYSPKNKDGSIAAYADHHTVWEALQERSKRSETSTKSKELAARSMTRPGSSGESKLQEDSHFKWLKENGLI